MEEPTNSQVNYSTLVINSRDFQSVSSAIPLTLVNTGTAAKTAILDKKRRFAAIFIDPVMPHPGGLALIKLAREFRPATPIFIIYRNQKPFSEEEAPRLAIQEQVQGPISASLIKGRISHEIYDYFFEAPEFPTFAERSADDDKYQAVPAADLLTGTPSVFDIFVRLPSGRYFKVLNAKDVFSTERLFSYIKKGVHHLYVSKASLNRSLSYCDVMAQFLVSNKAVSLEMKTTDLFNKGERLINSIKVEGLTKDHIDFAVTFVGQIKVFLAQIDLKNKEHIAALIEEMQTYDRAVCTAMLAGLLALPLKIESDSAFRAIGLAALLHDVGMIALPESIQKTGLNQMTAEQLAIYKTHPERGAEILSQIPQIESVSVQAVAQHHERRNNSGFPGKVKSSEINRIAELIGISNEFLDLLDAQKKDPTIYPLGQITKTFDGFSFQVIESFRTVFLNHPGGKTF